MPLSIFENESIVLMDTIIVHDNRQAKIIGVNSAGTIRIRYQDNGFETAIDPVTVGLTVQGAP
jgi:hypothetical protein